MFKVSWNGPGTKLDKKEIQLCCNAMLFVTDCQQVCEVWCGWWVSSDHGRMSGDIGDTGDLVTGSVCVGGVCSVIPT